MNVKLWFARNQSNEVIDIFNCNIDDKYTCPICTNRVVPKALESKKVTPHFAHVDVSKCNGEAMIHWWYKNKFIQKGDEFKIFTDKDIELTCKDFNTEVTYHLESGIYRPDLVVETECGQEIVFEMANTNKKMIKDYINRWIELDKIIVEVDIKSLQNNDDIKKFNALYFKGKCFNFNKSDGGYYSAIGKIKEEMNSKDEYDIELVKKLDWFWDELCKYKNKEIKTLEIIEITNLLFNEMKEHVVFLDKILSSFSCLKVKSKLKYYNSYCKFDVPIKNSSVVKETIFEFNKKYKPYKLKLERYSSKSYTNIWWNNVRQQKVDYYYYNINLIESKKNEFINSLPLTNLMNSKYSALDLLIYLENELKIKELVS